MRLATGDGDGGPDPLARRQLGAGLHRNLSVPVDADRLGEPGESVELRVELWIDDGDGEPGPGDRPARAGNATVGTAMRVEVPDATDEATGNATAGNRSRAPAPAGPLAPLAGLALAAAGGIGARVRNG